MSSGYKKLTNVKTDSPSPSESSTSDQSQAALIKKQDSTTSFNAYDVGDDFGMQSMENKPSINTSTGSLRNSESSKFSNATEETELRSPTPPTGVNKVLSSTVDSLPDSSAIFAANNSEAPSHLNIVPNLQHTDVPLNDAIVSNAKPDVTIDSQVLISEAHTSDRKIDDIKTPPILSISIDSTSSTMLPSVPVVQVAQVPTVTIEEPPVSPSLSTEFNIGISTPVIASPASNENVVISAAAKKKVTSTSTVVEAKGNSNQSETISQADALMLSVSNQIFQCAQRGEWAAVEQTLRKIEKGKWDATILDAETGECPLIWAVRDNKLVIVERLIECGVNINQRTNDGRTAVHFAAQFAKEEVLKLLLTKKADPNISGGVKNQLPLHLACQRSQSGLALVQLLLRNTRSNAANRFTPDKDGLICLMIAVMESNSSIVKELLERDAEAQVSVKRADTGDTALHLACRKCDIESIRFLVEASASMNNQNKEGHTPLHLSAAEGDEAAVKYFFTMKADASIMDKNDRSPLHMAAEKGHTKIVEVLIDKFKCNVLSRTKDGSTLMHVSSQFGHPDTTLAFLKRGVPLHMPNKAGAVCLHAAAKRGHANVVKSLLDKGAEVNARTKDKFTALHVAVEHCNPSVVETLLGFGAHVDVKGGEDEDTPLHIAARVKGGENCAEMLLKSGADVNRTNKLGETSLHTAARLGNLRMLQALLHEGGDPTLTCNQGNSPLHIAARHGRFHVAKEILDHVTKTKNRADAASLVNLGNIEGETPLHYAAELTKDKARSEFEDTDLIKLLLRTDGDMNVQTKYTLETPLHYCSRAGNEDVMLEIVKHLDYKIQLCVNKQTMNGWSPLLFASDSGQLAIVKILLNKHARVDVFDSKGFAALHLAAKNNHAAIVKALLDRNAFVNAKSKECFTPLHLAASEGHNIVVKMLVEQDTVEVDALTMSSRTPLHLAALNGKKEVCETLLDHGADAKATDHNGQTPLHLAAEHDRSDVVKMFLKKNDSVTLANADDKGFTCAHIAAFKGSISVIRELMRSNRAIICTAKTRTNGSTALHLAAQEGHAKVVKSLLDAGALPSEENGDGMTALHLAAQNGHSSVFEVLKEKINLRIASNKTGLTALHIAALNGKMDFVQEMLTHVPANLPSQKSKDPLKLLISDYGVTPLHLASQSGHENVVRFLVNSHGVNVETATMRQGTIALHLAAKNGMANVASLLLSKDTGQIRIADQQGRTALHHAANHGHYDVVALLIGQGADVNTRDSNLWTPLHLASKAGHLNVVTLLVDSKALTDNETTEKRLALAYAAESNHTEVVSYLLKRKHNTDQLVEDWRFLYDLMICSKINNFKTLQEFIIVSPAPVETAAKLSQNYNNLSEREKERARDLINMSKFCETMCMELVSIAAAENGAAKLLKAVDHRGVQFLDILIETEQKIVIAHPSVQRYLSDVWNGKLDWPSWKFFFYFTICLIPPVSMFVSLPLAHRYHRIPVIKFLAFLISHIHLILLFILVAIEPNNVGYPYWTRMDLIPTWLEWLLLVWLSGFLVSELINPADRSGLGLFKIGILAVSAFGILAHLIAFSYAPDDQTRLDILFIRNQLFALCTLICFATFLDFLTFHHVFGPWTIIIRNLMMDLLRFTVILGIFLLGFTLQMRAIFIPVYGAETPTGTTNKNMFDCFEMLFFALFGLVEPDTLPNIALAPFWTIRLVKTVFGCYMVIALIVLINLLIAMMSDTYQRIQAESDTEWKFGRAKLIRNMNKTSPTPSPLIIFTQLWYYVKLMHRRHKGQPILQDDDWFGDDDQDAEDSDFATNQSTNLLKGIFRRNTQVSPIALPSSNFEKIPRIKVILAKNMKGQTPSKTSTNSRNRSTSIETVIDWKRVTNKYISDRLLESGNNDLASLGEEPTMTDDKLDDKRETNSPFK